MVEHKSIFTYKDIAKASGNTIFAIYNAVKQNRLNPNNLKSICDYVNYKTLTELEEMKRLTRFWKKKAEDRTHGKFCNIYLNGQCTCETFNLLKKGE